MFENLGHLSSRSEEDVRWGRRACGQRAAAQAQIVQGWRTWPTGRGLYSAAPSLVMVEAGRRVPLRRLGRTGRKLRDSVPATRWVLTPWQYRVSRIPLTRLARPVDDTTARRQDGATAGGTESSPASVNDWLPVPEHRSVPVGALGLGTRAQAAASLGSPAHRAGLLEFLGHPLGQRVDVHLGLSDYLSFRPAWACMLSVDEKLNIIEVGQSRAMMPIGGLSG